MKVAHIFIRMPVGGAEDLVCGLLHTAPVAEDLKVICLQSLGKVGEALREKFPEQVELLPWVSGKQFSFLAVIKLARWFRDQKIDLVHTHVYNAHVYGALAALSVGIAAVIHHHKTYAQMRWRRKIVLRMLSRYAAGHITLSEKTRDDLCREFGIAKNKMGVFINPVDEQNFYPATDRVSLRHSLGLNLSTPWVGTVASLTPPKNHLLNVAMTSKLNACGFNGTFLIFGEGAEFARITEGAQSKSLGNFMLMGAKRPIAPWMQALDVFTLGSTWEGQPMALLQAMACELPIVASRIEGNEAVLGCDHPGLFDVNDEQAYADTVWRVLNDSAFRSRILMHQKQRQAQLPLLSDYGVNLVNFYKATIDRSA
jgi:glycosyltransferase involved in cell wall biosynthesis